MRCGAISSVIGAFGSPEGGSSLHFDNSTCLRHMSEHQAQSGNSKELLCVDEDTSTLQHGPPIVHVRSRSSELLEHYLRIFVAE